MGSLYTRHAIERMSPRVLGNAPGNIPGRSVPPSVTEEVIRTFTGSSNLRVREWLSNLSYREQHEKGIEIINKVLNK